MATKMKTATPEFNVLDIGLKVRLVVTGSFVQIVDVDGLTALAEYDDGESVLVRKGEYVGTVTYV